MPSRAEEIVSRLRREIPGITREKAYELLKDQPDSIAFLDVREPDEYIQGAIPGARYIPRSYLELRVEREIPEKETPVIVYCASGTRSLIAAQALKELGYKKVYNLEGGFQGWKNGGLPWVQQKILNRARSPRYSRHLLIPEVGEAGQKKLLESRVLLIGAGGLGSPAGFYLAAAGVGTIGIVDADLVDETNLQRQILHRTVDIGRPKVDSAREMIRNLNPDVEVVTYKLRLDSSNIYSVLDDGWDVVVDGSDNFPTRYLINDACYFRKIPQVHGSIFRFEGQVTVFSPDEGPCYRCLYPEPPPPELAPSCAEAGVLGVLPGIVGTIQAMEAIKILLGIGEPLIGRLLHYDALRGQFKVLRLERDPGCPLCGENPTVRDLIDYEFFCATAHAHAPA
jgi:adenylyltransferase/sulfurtransferase